MKKVVIAWLMSAVVIFAGCSDTAVNDSGSAAEEYTVAALFDKLENSGLCEAMDEREQLGGEQFDSACEKLYGQTADKFSDGGIMFNGAGQAADEVSALKSGSEDCGEILSQRVTRRYGDFEGYAPAELEKLDGAQIFEAGGLTILVISDNADEIRKIIEEG